MSNMTSNTTFNTTLANATKVASTISYTQSEKAICLIIIIVFGTLGGFFVQIFQGISMPKIGCLPGFKISPLLKNVKIPPLVGMIIFGVIARNAFGDSVKAYPSTVSSYLKYVCYCTLLIRAGLNIEPRGRIRTTILLTLIP